MKVYLSGPMTGLPNLNFGNFERSMHILQAMGYQVVNPAKVCKLPSGYPWHSYLRDDIKHLVTCDAISMLAGWQHSRGAMLELDIAIRLEMEFVEIPNELPSLEVFNIRQRMIAESNLWPRTKYEGV